MRVKQIPFRFDYLTVNGKYLTPFGVINNTSAAIVSSLTASQLLDFIATDDFTELAINLTIHSVSGTFATGQGLTVHFYVLDPLEPSNPSSVNFSKQPVIDLILNSTPITTVGTLRFVISKSGQATVWINGTATSLGTLTVPMMWQLYLVISGTTPSFSIIGTYEARA